MQNFASFVATELSVEPISSVMISTFFTTASQVINYLCLQGAEFLIVFIALVLQLGKKNSERRSANLLLFGLGKCVNILTGKKPNVS